MENNTVNLETLNGSSYDIDVKAKATKLLMFKIGELALTNPINEKILCLTFLTVLTRYVLDRRSPNSAACTTSHFGL